MSLYSVGLCLDNGPQDHNLFPNLPFSWDYGTALEAVRSTRVSIPDDALAALVPVSTATYGAFTRCQSPVGNLDPQLVPGFAADKTERKAVRAYTCAGGRRFQISISVVFKSTYSSKLS